MPRRGGGALSQAAGAGLERRLEALHALYAAQGRAWILPRPPRAVLKRGPGPPQLAGLQPLGADYAGTLAGGRSVSFDAKSTLDGMLRFRQVVHTVRGARDDRAQVRDLLQVAKMGGLAFYLVEVREATWIGCEAPMKPLPRRSTCIRGDYVVPVSDCPFWRQVERGEVSSFQVREDYIPGGGGVVVRLPTPDYLAALVGLTPPAWSGV